MPMWEIEQLELHAQTYRVEALDEAEAIQKLFSGEAELTHRIRGTAGFEQEFAAQGPRDRRGRSLREFDLERRLFKYPCSYLVYSPSFQALPNEAKQYVFDRLWSILNSSFLRLFHLFIDQAQYIPHFDIIPFLHFDARQFP